MRLTMIEKWKQALNNSLCVGAEFIDFQKAFETVSHLILSRKLQAIGICVISQTDRNYSILLLRAASLPLVVLMLASHRDLSLGHSIFVNDLPDCVGDFGDVYCMLMTLPHLLLLKS